MHRIML